MAENPLIKVRHKFKYNERYDEYTIQMTKGRNYWWLLLLLMPLFLFIKCQKDILVTCIDDEYNLPIADQTVTIEYTSYALWANGTFLNDSLIQQTQQTDSLGKAHFKDLPCSVYSYIFHCLQKALFCTKSECYNTISLEKNFHYTRSVELRLSPQRNDLQIQVCDLDTDDPLPDALLIYRYSEMGKEKSDSTRTDASGVAILPQMRYCSVIDEITGQCYGYADTTKYNILCSELLYVNDSTTLKLRPIKERFTFFVKNAENQEPIPGARCLVHLIHPGRSQQTTMRIVTTSIDGKGIAFYDDAFILSTLSIKASKTHFRDSILEGGPWIVKNFISQDDNTRTIWLEPEPFTEEFVNVDSITLYPIPGVRNTIAITSANGAQSSYTEVSNSNGVFCVSAKENDGICITSQKTAEYHDKHSVFSKFKDITKEERIIKMVPLMETLNFRTVKEEYTSELLPDCNLAITGSISGSLQPTNSGNGKFSVTMRKAELISIVASKHKYMTNDSKVRNHSWQYLSASQERRDIPLMLDLPPCSGGINTPKQTNEMYHQRSYGMGQMSGRAYITGNFMGVPDFLTVYDGPDTSGKVLIGPKLSIPRDFAIPFSFTKGAVTVVIHTSGNDSSWEYVVNCPQ